MFHLAAAILMLIIAEELNTMLKKTRLDQHGKRLWGPKPYTRRVDARAHCDERIAQVSLSCTDEQRAGLMFKMMKY